MENSVICSVRGEEAKFHTVIVVLQKSELPVIIQYNNGIMNFYYKGKCDANTAHHLEKIIKGLIGLYCD